MTARTANDSFIVELYKLLGVLYKRLQYGQIYYV